MSFFHIGENFSVNVNYCLATNHKTSNSRNSIREPSVLLMRKYR
jgi:hypothetical protein